MHTYFRRELPSFFGSFMHTCIKQPKATKIHSNTYVHTYRAQYHLRKRLPSMRAAKFLLSLYVLPRSPPISNAPTHVCMCICVCVCMCVCVTVCVCV